ncbi:NAD(P)H-dependent flavin oxidoreductase [Pseudonocardia spinosispora]|uniref:NAD(P)H-dependent flavin oxidoreductase n=1 Tax=Pseudonocardia spinosispora TaxID=103441 RepID=UPI000401E248|nr:nitronate monooxygenase [Pseudonocardia spinosispora]
MALRTAFTDLLSIDHPIASAPMGGSAGGELAAAVSNGGGLGLVGGGRGERAWLERELAIVTARTSRPWGVGFLAWAVEVSTVEWVLDQGPAAVMLSFGDPGPFAARVHAAGIPLIIQVTDLDEARRAVDLGADLLVAQGAESGGHGGRRSTLTLVPAVVDLVAPVPVLAAGGIADGRGVAAALVLGAVGALLGTRFQASHEALVDAEIVKAIVGGLGADTERSRVLDVARDSGWPARYTARVVTNSFLDTWRGREQELERDVDTRRAYREAAARGDLAVVSVWASEAIDLITEVASATELVRLIAEETERAFTCAT